MFSISMMAWFSLDGERETIELVDRDLFTWASKGATFLHSFIFMAFDDILRWRYHSMKKQYTCNSTL